MIILALLVLHTCVVSLINADNCYYKVIDNDKRHVEATCKNINSFDVPLKVCRKDCVDFKSLQASLAGVHRSSTNFTVTEVQLVFSKKFTLQAPPSLPASSNLSSGFSDIRKVTVYCENRSSKSAVLQYLSLFMFVDTIELFGVKFENKDFKVLKKLARLKSLVLSSPTRFSQRDSRKRRGDDSMKSNDKNELPHSIRTHSGNDLKISYADPSDMSTMFGKDFGRHQRCKIGVGVRSGPGNRTVFIRSCDLWRRIQPPECSPTVRVMLDSTATNETGVNNSRASLGRSSSCPSLPISEDNVNLKDPSLQMEVESSQPLSRSASETILSQPRKLSLHRRIISSCFRSWAFISSARHLSYFFSKKPEAPLPPYRPEKSASKDNPSISSHYAVMVFWVLLTRAIDRKSLFWLSFVGVSSNWRIKPMDVFYRLVMKMSRKTQASKDDFTAGIRQRNPYPQNMSSEAFDRFSPGPCENLGGMDLLRQSVRHVQTMGPSIDLSIEPSIEPSMEPSKSQALPRSLLRSQSMKHSSNELSVGSLFRTYSLRESESDARAKARLSPQLFEVQSESSTVPSNRLSEPDRLSDTMSSAKDLSPSEVYLVNTPKISYELSSAIPLVAIIFIGLFVLVLILKTRCSFIAKPPSEEDLRLQGSMLVNQIDLFANAKRHQQGLPPISAGSSSFSDGPHFSLT